MEPLPGVSHIFHRSACTIHVAWRGRYRPGRDCLVYCLLSHCYPMAEHARYIQVSISSISFTSPVRLYFGEDALTFKLRIRAGRSDQAASNNCADFYRRLAGNPIGFRNTLASFTLASKTKDSAVLRSSCSPL